MQEQSGISSKKIVLRLSFRKQSGFLSRYHFLPRSFPSYTTLFIDTALEASTAEALAKIDQPYPSESEKQKRTAGTS